MTLARVVCLASLLLSCSQPGTDPPGSPDGPPDAAVDDGADPVDAAIDAVDGPPVPEPPSLDARLLVIAATGSEVALVAIRQALDFQGTPYTVWIAAQRPGELTPAVLFEGLHGFYQGVILTSGKLNATSSGPSTLSDGEWQALREYQATFGVRQVTLFTKPTAELGFGAPTTVSTSTAPIAATLSPAGRAVFPYLTGDLTIRDVTAYLAAPADADTTPLLTDGAGHALVAVKRYPDGRQNLALTFDGSERAVHAIALSYGVIDWVTRGVFIGERHVFATPQVDDVFLANNVYASPGVTFRMSGDDLRAVVRWQQAVQQRPTTAGMVLTMAFNGRGTTNTSESLTAAALELMANFWWISHTWSHEDLDVADYALTMSEIVENNERAQALALGPYDATAMVTPGHSGLFHAPAMAAMRDYGIRYLISNTSRPEEDNPFPNVGFFSALQPDVFIIPRHPTEIYVDTSTPAQEEAAYNARRAPTTPMTYAQIIDKESDRMLRYMLTGDMDPWMFHQPNLRAYDGTHSLLGDLVDRTLTKYEAVFNLPVLTLEQADLGARMKERTVLHGASVTAVIVPGRHITITADREVTVPVTGLPILGAEQYGGQPIARVHVTAGTPVTFPLQ